MKRGGGKNYLDIRDTEVKESYGNFLVAEHAPNKNILNYKMLTMIEVFNLEKPFLNKFFCLVFRVFFGAFKS